MHGVDVDMTEAFGLQQLGKADDLVEDEADVSVAEVDTSSSSSTIMPVITSDRNASDRSPRSACYVSQRRRRGVSVRVCGVGLGWSRHDRGHTGDNMTLTDVAAAAAARGDAVTTVASLARGWAQRSPKQVSMREKDFGIWREYTWEQTWELIEDAAHGLLALGVDTRRSGLDPLPRIVPSGSSSTWRPSPCVASPSGCTRPTRRRRWSTCSATRGAKVHLAEDQEQADKVLRRSTAQRFPELRSDHLRRAARPAGSRRPAPVLGGLPRARPRPSGRAPGCRRPSAWRRPRPTT